MTKAEMLTAAGIPVSNDALAVLRVEAAFDWMKQNTTLQFDVNDAETITALPATAKLFVVKYGEAMQRKSGVTSQSIEGLSMSFDASENATSMIWALANTLLSGYLKSQVRVTPARRRW